MKRYKLHCVFAAFVAVALLAGCGGESTVEADDTTLAAPETAPAGDVEVTALLTPADVEAVSGLSGLRVVPYDPAVGAGGDVNIADESGQLVAMLVVDGLETWDAWKTDGTTFSAEYTPTVGDESYTGPTGADAAGTYIFGFRSGETAVVIDTFFVPSSGTTVLTISQLAELAEIVAARL